MTQQSETCQNETTPPDIVSGEDMQDQHSASFVNNGSVSGTLGQHYDTLIIQNGGERALSDECAELIRIYESLGIKQRIRLLNFAFSLEDGKTLESGDQAEQAKF